MIEDPRKNAPEEEDEDEIYEDEISLDELEGDLLGFSDTFDAAPSPQTEAPRAPGPPADDGDADADDIFDDFDDAVTLDELDNDTAGFFEVFASPAPPEPEAPTPAADEELFEVQAAPPPPPRAEPPPQAHVTPPSTAQAEHDRDSIRRLHDVEVEVIATLGTTRMQIQDILGLQVGSVVELHRMVGEPVDVTLNGRLIARGEVVVVDEKFAIRVHEIVGNGA